VQVGLSAVVAGVHIVPDRTRPLVEVVHGRVHLAGDNPRLRTSALHGATAPVTLLVAHIATLLNEALTEVTDAKEHDALVRLTRAPATSLPAADSG
jgi:hypothetical protein